MRALGRYSVSSFLAGLLSVAWWGLAIALAIAVCLTVFSPWIDLGGNGQLGIPVALAVDEHAVHVTAPALAVETARLTKVTGTLQFEAPSRRTLIAPLLTIVAMLVIALWVLAQLRALFGALRAGHPFATANAARIQRVGWAVILMEPIGALIIYSAQRFAAANFVADGLRFVTDLHFNLGTIFGGLVILVLAEVFRAGTRLDHDQSLTI